MSAPKVRRIQLEPRTWRGNVLRLRPGHWWFEVYSWTGQNRSERIEACGSAATQVEALELCHVALIVEQGRPRRWRL